MAFVRAALLAAVLLFAGLTATAGSAPAGESAGASCRGGLTAELGGSELRVRAIRTNGMSCRSGKRLIRRFFDEADSDPGCRSAAEKPPPTPGCSVGRFQCWRGVAKYCARRGHDVSWRDGNDSAPPESGQAPGLIPSVSKIRPDGIGKVRIGMTVKEARDAAGVHMERSRVGDCVYLSSGPPGTGQGPTLRFHEGRLRRVHVARKGFATKRGVEVGDRVREVRRKYSGLRRDIDLGGGYTLIWKRGKGRLMFTIGGGKVLAIAGGPVPWVLQQECV